MKKIITFVDLQGRYRVFSPGYNNSAAPLVPVATIGPLRKRRDDFSAVIAEAVQAEIVRLGLSPDHRFRAAKPVSVGEDLWEIEISRRETDDECLERTWLNYTNLPGAEVPFDHPKFIVDNDAQAERLGDCCVTYFRHGVFELPNREGFRDKHGKVILVKDDRDGAWEMDVDGRPKINMAKAQRVHMDCIRLVRNRALERESGSRDRQPPEIEALFTPERKARLQALRDIPQTFGPDLARCQTPTELRAKWPAGLGEV